MSLPSKVVASCVALSLLLPAAASAQATYRWLDKDGRVNYSDQPPPPEAKNAEERKLGSPNAIATSGPDYGTRRAAQAAPVTLYVSADCVAECKLARDFLREARIPYSEKVIKTPEDAAGFKRATSSEDLLVPTLLVGTLAQKGYEDGAWRKLLAAAGYPLADAASQPPR